MNTEIFSNHIGNASELTVLADIKKGFVPVMEPLTYAARLRIHLRMLSALRRNGLETDRGGVYVGPVDNLRTLQFVRWTLVENDTKMLLSVNFDRALEPYIRLIVDIAGPLLDTILCHCENFVHSSSDQGFEKFLAYATRYQVPVELFAAAAPDISVDDGDYFLKLDRTLRSGDNPNPVDLWQPAMRMTTPKERLNAARQNNGLALLDTSINILRTMHENSDRFPEMDSENVETRDDLLYYNLAKKLVPGFWDALRAGLLQSPLKDHPVVTGDWTIPPVEALTQLLCGAAQQHPDVRRFVRMCELFSQNQQALLWFANAPRPRKTPDPVIPRPSEIQAGLLRADKPVDGVTIPKVDFVPTHACMVLMRVDIPEQGGIFLNDMDALLWPNTPTHPQKIPDGQIIYNLAVTHNGLKSLRVPEDMRRSLPHAFREGMDRRAGLLGDTDVNHPKEWKWPAGNWPVDKPVHRPVAPSSIDLIVQMQAAFPNAPVAPKFDKDHPLYDDVKALADMAAKRSVDVLAVEPMQRRDATQGKFVGHIRFADGISQPRFGADKSDPDFTDLGDLLVGHPSIRDRGVPAEVPHPALQNGTFMVIRKTHLDVARFDETAKNFDTDAKDVDEDLVKAKMVGRNADGTALQAGAKDYESDPDGLLTPLQSHVRRANPRMQGDLKPENPRILRRGYSYGPYLDEEPDPNVDRGQFFIAYNASIPEQFEVIQRWISGGNGTGIASWHGDPLLAPKRPEGIRNFRFVHNKSLVNVDLGNKPIGTLQWGLYAFSPARDGLKRLAELAAQRSQSHLAGLGDKDGPALSLQPSDDSDAWKLVLENADDETRAKREALWAEIRQEKEGLDTGYGVLVGSEDGVAKVLNDDGSTYSVCTYLDRMKDTVGPQYLGVDDPAEHAAESSVLNAFLGTLSNADMFDQTYSVASKFLQNLPEQTQSREDDGQNNAESAKMLGRRFESEQFILDTIAELSVRWFGLPRDHLLIGGPEDLNNPLPHCPRDVLPASFYVFGAHPTPHLTDYAKDRTPRVRKAIEGFVSSQASGETGDLLHFMRDVQKDDQTNRWTDQKIAEFMAGACFGFAGPVSGSFRSVLYDWIKDEQLWRLHQRFHGLLQQAGCGVREAADIVLRPAIIESMGKRPIPDLLYRTIKQGKDTGKFCAFSLRSAIADGGDPETYLFGGDYDADPYGGPKHKCPGKSMGLAVIMGGLAAIFEYSKLQPEGPLSLWLQSQTAQHLG